MTKTYGAAIIGGGVIFRDHARAYTQLAGRVRMIGLADVDATRARSATDQFFIPFSTSNYQELLARDDADIVNVCTPPNLHEEMVVAALSAGKYVVCEKPLAHTLAACDRIREAAERHPGKLSTVYQLRYAPESKRTIWARDNGVLGEICFGRFSRYGTIDERQKTKGWWGKWSVAGGGAVMTQCIHELDLMLYFMGPVRRVTASMATLGHEIESEDTFSATIEFDSGALATCYCSLAGNTRFGFQWDVVGRKATAQFPWAFNTRDSGLARQMGVELGRRFPGGPRPSGLPGIAGKVANRVKRKLSRRAAAAGPTQHTEYLRAVLDAMDAGRPLPIGPDDARRSVEVCTAIYESAILQKPVELPLDSSSRFYEGVTTDDYDGRKMRETALVPAT
jgi:predicted dehydrogenase